jgi:hypothetical protein
MGTDAGETPRARAHHVTDPLIEVDLAIELEAVRAGDSYRAADHAAKTIAKQPGVLTRGRLRTVPPRSGAPSEGYAREWVSLDDR